MTKRIPKKKSRPGVNVYGRSELHCAVIDNDIKKVKELIKNGFDINLQDDNGFTPLHFAAQVYSKESINLLLKSGANTKIVDSYGNNPLFRAVFNSQNKDLTVLDLLISAGANINQKNKSGVSVVDLVNTIDNQALKDFFNKIKSTSTP